MSAFLQVLPAAVPPAPTGLTATAGNDTVRLLTQLKEYNILNDKLTMAGAAGAVTQENISAMAGAGEGFLSAAGYSIDIDKPANASIEMTSA